MVREEGPGVERRPGVRGEVTQSRHDGLAVLLIGHALPAVPPPEDDVGEDAGRRFRTQCGRASSRACRGIVGLGLLSGAGGANQEQSTESTTCLMTPPREPMAQRPDYSARRTSAAARKPDTAPPSMKPCHS